MQTHGVGAAQPPRLFFKPGKRASKQNKSNCCSLQLAWDTTGSCKLQFPTSLMQAGKGPEGRISTLKGSFFRFSSSCRGSLTRFTSSTLLPFFFWAPLLKPKSRKKGTLIIKGPLENLVKGFLMKLGLQDLRLKGSALTLKGLIF